MKKPSRLNMKVGKRGYFMKGRLKADDTFVAVHDKRPPLRDQTIALVAAVDDEVCLPEGHEPDMVGIPCGCGTDEARCSMS